MKIEMRDSQFMTAREKELVLKAWVTFLKHGLKFSHFTKALYNHLTLHCSFIAHYDRAGFYGVYFEHGDDTKRFLSQFDAAGPCVSIEYGYTGWKDGDFSDLNNAMIEAAKPYIPELIRKASASQRDADVAQANALLRKHGLA